MMRKKTTPVPGALEERDPHPTLNRSRRNTYFHISEAGRSRLTQTHANIDLARHQRAVDIDIEKKLLQKELLALNGGRVTPNIRRTRFQDDTHLRTSDAASYGAGAASSGSNSEKLYRRRRSRSFADISDDIKRLGDIPEVRSRTSTPVSTHASGVSCSNYGNSGFTKRTRSVSDTNAPVGKVGSSQQNGPRGRPKTSSLPIRLRQRAATVSSSTAYEKHTSSTTHNSISKPVLTRSVSEDNRITTQSPDSQLKNRQHSASVKSNGQPNRGGAKLFTPRPPSSTSASKLFEQRSHQNPPVHGRRRSSSLTDIAKFQEVMELRDGHDPSAAGIKNDLRHQSRTATEMTDRVLGNRRRSSSLTSLSDIEKFQQMRRAAHLPSIAGLPSSSSPIKSQPKVPGVNSPHQGARPRSGYNRRRSSSLSELELYQQLKKNVRSDSTAMGRPHHMEERALERKRSDSIYQTRDSMPHGYTRRRSSSLSDVKLYHNNLRGQGPLFEDREHEDDISDLSSKFDALQDCSYLRVYIPKHLR